MSEEILKALMQLFAILIKQDGGLEENELAFVRNFLFQQIGQANKDEYLELFLESAGKISGKKESSERENKLTSVMDSVKILGICRKINLTLNQHQKYIMLVRLFELAGAKKEITPQRLAIIKTAADVFKIPEETFYTIESFLLEKESGENRNLLFINSDNTPPDNAKHIHLEYFSGQVVVLRIPENNLYFLRYKGVQEIFLNGRPIHPQTINPFPKGSNIRFPVDKPVFYSDVSSCFLQDNNPDPISFVVDKLEYRFRNNQTGLRNISFSASEGQLVGIMGSSGSGKTTLLNVLSGIVEPYSGSVKINGSDINAKGNNLYGVMGYIPQDDLLIEELSVFENLYYNAKLCFRDLSEEEIKVKVNAILDNLGLIDKKDLRVGSVFNKSISGGERKRLNIALELIREPSILFIDEPTSGLSSRDSENVIDLLRELSLKGKLVFIVIHQPSSDIYKMFDEIVILDEGGYMVYNGNPVEAITYFKNLDAQINSGIAECPSCGNVNPELIFNILEAHLVDEYGHYTKERKVKPEKWEAWFQRYRKHEESPAWPAKLPVNLKIPSLLKQLKIFLTRDIRSKIANRQYIFLTLAIAPALALILSYIIRYIADPLSNTYIFRENENIPIYIFMLLIVSVFLGLILSAEEIFRDRKILKRERFLHLSRSSYLLSKVLVLFLISAFQAFLFVLIANSVLGIKNMGIYYWFAFFSTAACANMIGLNISSSFNSAITIYIVIPLIIIPMMILSGAMFSFGKLNRSVSRIDKVPMLAELIPTRWSYEALMVNQFKKNFFEVNFYGTEKAIVNADFKQSWFIPELENRLRYLQDEYLIKGNIKDKSNDFLVLVNELKNESGLTPAINTPDSLMMNSDAFNPAIAEQFDRMLKDLNQYYLGVFTSQNRAKNNTIKNLLRNKQDTYYQYLDNFHNESLADIVRKIYEKKKIVEFNHRLIRISDPIFLDPEPEGPWSIRTHFFAPQKHFLGKYYDTFGFNMVIIWIFTSFFYGTLYFEVFKKRKRKVYI